MVMKTASLALVAIASRDGKTAAIAATSGRAALASAIEPRSITSTVARSDASLGGTSVSDACGTPSSDSSKEASTTGATNR